MVIYDGKNRHYPIKSGNLRTCKFYLDWMNISKNIRADGVNRQDAESCRQATNQLINQFFPDKEMQNRLLAEMNAACDENILSSDSFDWLKQDERATFWLWAYILKAGDYELGIDPPANADFGKNWYQRMNLSVSPTSHQERINIIISFFDNIIIPTPPVNHLKRQVMDRLKDQWKAIYSKPVPLKWLPDEEEAVLWAWNSLKSLQEERNTPKGGLSFTLSTPGMSTWFTPLSHSERNLALRAAIDLWDDAPDTKRLFLLNLNKAWNQQKLRQSRTDKKALNTYLKNETKMRLDILATHYNMRISDVLEKLINEHYRQELPPSE
ncbi:hypothetical protein IHA60_000526 [Salmonella enterica]|nr:hypothetical protein [Salmonella enterica]ECD0155583.1 hypothetical protein [Salmonella enterica subsp. enterica]ECX3452109.1 hypothetical protein [Salmonella enterica subsp. enterica serovar Rubislaw]EDR3484913.1 hypothetical protein [Salmonella enterica subsp. enterica serovar Midway]EDS7168490.1 hypothetical protein [Salmonella enterica subsp. enterica serovar Florida]EFO5649724.1 hypothetical protein [Salmonella enterica subsp. enterica serovar Miami]